MTTDDPRLLGVIEGRLLAGPETLQVNLQNACNLNCVFCWSYAPLAPVASDAWKAERLSDAHLDAVVDALPRLRPARLQVSGKGEPLLHPGAERLLAAARDAGVASVIQTNGTAGPSPDALADLDVARLLVNVSAGTAAGYEATHPGRGHLFDAVLARLERLAALRARAPAPGRARSAPDVTLVVVVQATNAFELPAVVDLAARVGADSVQAKGMELGDGLAPLMLDRASRRRALDALHEAQARGARLGVAVHGEHLAQVAAHQRPDGVFTADLRHGPCYMGWYYLRVTSDGRVMFCCKDKQVDHLDRRGLYAIWRSAAYQHLRLAARDGDAAEGPFDAKCAACSNFERNRRVHADVAAHGG